MLTSPHSPEVAMKFQAYLDEAGIPYRLSHHPNAYTAQDLAALEHVPGRRVIKSVIVRADGELLLCALPASYRIDLHELREQLQAEDVRLVDEAKLADLFPDCELGAEPPVGKLYGLTTLMDESLIADDRVTFAAGSHAAAVTMRLSDYRRLAQPEVAHFGRHA
jgi:Ala-tRNA(Pro) deacylase